MMEHVNPIYVLMEKLNELDIPYTVELTVDKTFLEVDDENVERVAMLIEETLMESEGAYLQ